MVGGELTVHGFHLTLITIMPRCLLSGPVYGVLPGRAILRIGDLHSSNPEVGHPFETLMNERDGVEVLEIRTLESLPWMVQAPCP